MSKVYFTRFNSKSNRTNIPNKIRMLFDKVEGDKYISDGDNIAVKLHFGEKGNTTYTHPVFVRQIVDKVKESGGKPFLTDTNTLYSGSRTNSVDHIETAISNGFSYAVVGAPIIIADGLHSKNFVEVDIDGKHFKKVKIAGDIYNSQGMVVVSHFKGHEMAGFGGTLKNLAMGCASASGKQMQHSDVKPNVKKDKCVGCGLCINDCPVSAIKFIKNNKAEIDESICYGCGECITKCPVRAISVQWQTKNDVFIEKMAEFALGAVKNKKDKVIYFNFVMNITPLCDCVPWSGEKLAEDIGILASNDPLSIDKASYDLILKSANEDVFCKAHPAVSGEDIFPYAEKLGIGDIEYELVEV